ncbi:glycosyltransferase family 4 protein [Pararhodonellum marinum]|uniref:glycosyltransferase family 4 protein n=1 Tax=Pararhodonellum marinum TaxID=2755358 RepID=UPI00188F2D24|nr:glycosyltransferase [Pararhodonellum marinum]
MNIIHISFDFPDPINPRKTKAVANLIEAQSKYQNVVFSLNRSTNIFSDYLFKKKDNIYYGRIWGLPYGIGLRISMFIAYKRIFQILKNENIKVSLIHAHKLTFEGIVAYFLTKKLNVPFILTFRGDTDLKLLSYKIELRHLYKKILKKSKKIIFLAPWPINSLKNHYQSSFFENKSIVLPNIISINDSENKNTESKRSNFLTVFHLNSYKRKNIKRLILAFSNFCEYNEDVFLDIVGGGSKLSVKIINKFIENTKFPNRIRLLGEKSHIEVLKIYSSYLGFVLPSYPETFGLVFIEALNAGTPILYSKNSGIDGFFQNKKIGEKVTYTSIKEISDSLLNIYTSNEEYLCEIRSLKKTNSFEKFTFKSVSNTYVNSVIEGVKD